jgi:molybdopterin synthase catalytic subunit
MIDIRIQAEPFDIASEQESLWREHPQVGALVTFVGLMRNMSEGDRVSRMTLEHYPGMTEKALTAIAEEADGRWDLQAIRILHRVGELEPQDPIVLVAVTSTHRGDAFRACELLIDYLKTRAPFWKKEILEGGERWVEARATDETAAQRWEPAQGTTSEENGRQSAGSGAQDASNADKKHGQSAWEALSKDNKSRISDV